MERGNNTPLTQALYRILRPLARLLLRNGIAYQQFAELVKRAYVDAAREDFQGRDRKPSDSRTAVMTGLTRKDVKRLREQSEAVNGTVPAAGNRVLRVVSGWVHDPAFQEQDGAPAVLAFDGGFAELVRRYSGDMTPRAVLEELERVGVATESDGVHLLRRSLIAGDDHERLAIFGEGVSDLVRTMDHNLSGGSPLFQRTLSYNRVPERWLPQWRAYSAERCQALLEELDDWLARADADVSGEGMDEPLHRTGVSVFQFEDPSGSPEANDD
ncbi:MULTISPECIES: DUF6502 family protein [Halomonadaceae]|uniref:Uncharacterized protein n=1 Tax=Vreelandella halophila TaxID=86177 RepID=A0A9X5B3U4_9GAMM|nr:MULTISPECIES: DUF6502 family protein [Halomonas]MYL25946.1 hypothetical protein [Halomonas utahensis]MYL73492.1 hypothetical protein [Halomonas sp. 22501_18_FS]